MLSTGVAYLVGVLVVSTFWGLRLGLLTALASAAAFNFFHIPPDRPLRDRGTRRTGSGSASSSSRRRSRRRSATSPARAPRRPSAAARRPISRPATARVLLGGGSLDDALPETARLIGDALGLPDTEIVLAERDDSRRRAPRPRTAAHRDPRARRRAPTTRSLARVRERVAPALEALLRAALDRDRLQAEVIETQALRRSDVIKTALLRAVSHDLRTPLTAILTAGDALRSPSLTAASATSSGSSSSRRRSGCRRSSTSCSTSPSCSRARRSRGATGARSRRSSARPRPRSPARTTRRFALSFDADLPLVQADAAQLERVFVNLLENARRYSGGHPVKVRARVVGGKLVIRVIDRGPGMSARELTRVVRAVLPRAEADAHRGLRARPRDRPRIRRGQRRARPRRVAARPGHGLRVELPLAEACRREGPP